MVLKGGGGGGGGRGGGGEWMVPRQQVAPLLMETGTGSRPEAEAVMLRRDGLTDGLTGG